MVQKFWLRQKSTDSKKDVEYPSISYQPMINPGPRYRKRWNDASSVQLQITIAGEKLVLFD
jgi:hypothetical protein